MKYRKKPIAVQAQRWMRSGDHPAVGDFRHPPVDPVTGEISAAEDAQLLGEARHRDTPGRFRREACDYLMHDHGHIDTLEGGHIVCPGDWIITGVQGETYPCKPDIFEATYEEAGDQE